MPRRRRLLRGRLLKKVGRLADQVWDEVRDEIQDSSVAKLASQAKQVAVLSRETVQICDETAVQRQRMVALSGEIHATLQQLTTGKDASQILETIRQLTSGDALREATEIATGLHQAAGACVNKSLQMVQLLDQSVDCLPEPLQKLLQGDDDDGDDDDGDDDDDDDDVNQNRTILMKDLERDVNDVQTCIQAIQHLNLTTAFTVGVQAFQQLANKVTRAQALFDQLRKFASELTEMAHAMETWNARGVAREAKDLLQCLRWTDELQETAQAAAKLMPVVIHLFQTTADRVSVLWAALAHAKDCLVACIEHVKQTKQLCRDAQEKSIALVKQSLHIKTQLEQILRLSNMKQSVSTVRSLVSGGEIQQAIDLATHMDDLIVECAKKAVAMINQVQDGYNNMPTILTEGTNVAAAGTGRSQGDPEPANVERDLVELEESRIALTKADLVTAAQAGVRAFTGVSEKSTVGTDLLHLVEQFATDCHGTIESFLTVWDLPSAGKKITEMCNLVNLGTVMKQFAEQIQRLLVGIVTLLKVAIDKFKNLDMGDIGETLGVVKNNLEEKVDDLKHQVHDNLDDLKDQLQDKLQFWK